MSLKLFLLDERMLPLLLAELLLLGCICSYIL
jgi:hypothetical protein